MFLITLSVTNKICHFLINGKLFLLSSTVTLFVNDFYEGKRVKYMDWKSEIFTALFP